HHLATALARRAGPGDLAEAAALASAAAAQARVLGMHPLAEAASPTRPASTPGSAPAPAPRSLTPREREVAELVARGLTSRAIAAGLHLSERTVETHVQHILAKLGLANRTQLATWVLRLRTPDT